MENSIVVYTSTGCTYCEKVISILEEGEVPFEEKNISRNEDFYKEWKSKEVIGTPVTFYNEDMVLGVEKSKLEELIKKYKETNN